MSDFLRHLVERGAGLVPAGAPEPRRDVWAFAPAAALAGPEPEEAPPEVLPEMPPDVTPPSDPPPSRPQPSVPPREPPPEVPRPEAPRPEAQVREARRAAAAPLPREPRPKGEGARVAPAPPAFPAAPAIRREVAVERVEIPAATPVLAARPGGLQPQRQPAPSARREGLGEAGRPLPDRPPPSRPATEAAPEPRPAAPSPAPQSPPVVRPAPVRPPALPPSAPRSRAPEEGPGDDDRPVHVHIGTIEVKARPPRPAPPSPAAPPRPVSLGFGDYAALRNYRTWRDV